MKTSIVIICFLSLFSIGFCSLLGARECTYGPSYWCDSIRNAHQCNAVKHCIQTVWEKQVLPEDNDDICTLCKDMVQEARDQLLSNETQDEIRQVFEGSCKLIPIDVVREECIKLSDDFIPQLIDTLASQMNPQVVCATAGLCNSPIVNRLLREYKKEHGTDRFYGSPVKTARDCKDCKSFLTDVINIVNGHSRSELMDHLLAICGRLVAMSDGCRALVMANIDNIHYYVTEELDPIDICDLFGMCEGLGRATVSLLPKTEDEPCDFCVAIVNGWRNNLISNTTREQFKMIMDGICRKTGNFEKECLSLVDQYFEMVYDIMISEIHPKEICNDVGLCGRNSIFNAEIPIWILAHKEKVDRLPLIPLRPSFDSNDLIGLDEANSYRHNIPLARVSISRSAVEVISVGEKGIAKSSNACVMCEFVLHFLQNVLQEKKTREEIKEAVENVCQLLPHSVSEECEDYIDAYGDQIIQMLILELDPATICPMLNLCPQKSLKKPVLEDVSCVMCEYAMTELDEILKDKDNEEQIKKTVESLCGLLPHSIFKDCQVFIDNYVDQIVDLLVNDFTPRQICGQLGLCPTVHVTNLLLAKPSKAQLPVSRYFIPDLFQEGNEVDAPEAATQSAACTICEFVMVKIDSMILENSTEKSIVQTVDKVCLLLPTTLMNDCLGFLEDYGDALVEMLVSKMKPAVICREIKLCKDNAHKGLFSAKVSEPANKCDMCTTIVNWVKDTKTSEDLDSAIPEHLCDQLSGQFRDECINFAETNGDFLTKLIEKLEDSVCVCQALDMCVSHKNNIQWIDDCMKKRDSLFLQ